MIHPADSFKGLNITINTTEDCNLRCKYCYETCKTPKTIDLDTCKKFIDIILDDPDPCLLKDTDRIYAYDGYIFDFIGGDSLMNVDILDKIMSYITTKMTLRENQPINGYRFSLSSNGTLFELPKVRELVASRLDMHEAVDEVKSTMLKALAQLESNENLNDKACEHLLSAQQIINNQDVKRRLALVYSKMRLFEKASQYFVGICSK